jgi:hypothetical protein
MSKKEENKNGERCDCGHLKCKHYTGLFSTFWGCDVAKCACQKYIYWKGGKTE